jgi:hypothetical protein
MSKEQLKAVQGVLVRHFVIPVFVSYAFPHAARAALTNPVG